MRRLLLAAAVLAALAFSVDAAQAAGRGHRHYAPSHYGYDYYESYRPYGYRHGYGYRYRNRGFDRAAEEVRQAHSRYRLNTHPRSYFNAAPPRYYWGW